MERFYVIDTWNGEGYSESDLLQTFDNKDDAIEFAFDKAVEMYIATSGESLEVENKLLKDDDSYISVTEIDTDREDSGCIHVLKGDIETKGIMIRPETCSADLLDDKNLQLWVENILADSMDDHSKQEFRNSLLYGTKADCHTNSFGFCKIIKLA